MSRSLLAGLLLCIAATAAGAQSATPVPVRKDAPHATSSREHSSGWRELDAYHMVMMGVWHPAKEKGDLAPIRARAAALAASGETLAGAAVPAACDRPETRTGVELIARESRALDALVARNAPDAEVKLALTALHDRFELVNRRCTVPGAAAGARHRH